MYEVLPKKKKIIIIKNTRRRPSGFQKRFGHGQREILRERARARALAQCNNPHGPNGRVFTRRSKNNRFRDDRVPRAQYLVIPFPPYLFPIGQSRQLADPRPPPTSTPRVSPPIATGVTD